MRQNDDCGEVKVLGQDGPAFLSGLDHYFIVGSFRREYFTDSHDVVAEVPKKFNCLGRDV